MPKEQTGATRIVVINDEPTFLALMQELLEVDEGYEVEVSTEGEGAYAFVKDRQPDLVILDLVMGQEAAGWKTLDLLKLDPATSGIPVILCTAALSALTQNAPVLEQHAVQSLAKPFDLDDLLGKIKATLAQYAREG